jgi:O-antigen biosynthesis protein
MGIVPRDDGSLGGATTPDDLQAPRVPSPEMGAGSREPVTIATGADGGAQAVPFESPELVDSPGADLPASEASFRPVKVLDIDLDRPLEDIAGLDPYGSVQALVRIHGAPLGYVRLPVIAGSCRATTQRDAIVGKLGRAVVTHLVEDRLAAGLRRRPWTGSEGLLAAPHAGADRPTPSVTVAVCTRDHPDSLARCLASIDALDPAATEVVVVDNAPSSTATEDLVAARWPRVRYVREDRPGLDWARNRAVHEARSEIVAFTDDDVVVDVGWVGAITTAFAEDEGLAALTGLVVPLALETRAQMLFEVYGGFGRGFRRVSYKVGRTAREHVGSGRFGTGANMAYRKDVIDAIGGFDPALDVGTVTNGGGDIEMFFRVLQEGYTLVYEPAAVVRHEHRHSHEELRTQLTNHGIGFASYLVRSFQAYPEQRRSFVSFVGWWLRRWILRRLLVSIVRPGRFPSELVFAELRGALIGLTRYSKSRRHAARTERAQPLAVVAVEAVS